MKFNSSLFSMLLAIVLLSSCESTDDAPRDGSQADATELRSAAQSGQWQVTYYFDDTDETSDYVGYVFTFSSDGTVVAEKDGTQVTGTWSVTVDVSDSMDDSPDDDSDDVDFNISFAAPADFAELTDDWDIMEYSDVLIRLIDISGGDGGTDYLTFEKN